MIFTAPKPFKEAIASRQLKTALPTSMSSAQLQQLEPEILERAVFSARTTNAEVLNRINSLVTRIVSPETIDGRPVAAGESMNPATARLELKKLWQSLGYQPDPAQRGGLQDLSSDTRLDLIIRTNVEMAQGHGNWIADQDPARLDAWPAQELYRLEDRAEPRDWPSRWVRAGGQIFSDRMIALKNDPVWGAISAFGHEYPPYDFNSGMWVRDISRAEAIDMGVMAPDSPPPEPADTRGFNADLQASVTDLAEPLQDALMKSMKGLASFADGVLRFTGGLA